MDISRTPDEMLNIFFDVLKERVAQDEEFGEQNNSLPEWMNILLEEVGEAARDTNKIHWGNDSDDRLRHMEYLRQELVQSAAVAMAMIQCLDRNFDEYVEGRIRGRSV